MCERGYRKRNVTLSDAIPNLLKLSLQMQDSVIMLVS